MRRAVVLAMLALPLGAARCDNLAEQPAARTWRPPAASDPISWPPAPPDGIVAREDEDGAAPPLSIALVARGRDRFDIACAPCHGAAGDGDGMIVQRGFPRPPSLHEPRLREAPTRHVFDVATRGWGAMYGYADRVPARDRWAIAAYVRALQASRRVAAATLPDTVRAQLK